MTPVDPMRDATAGAVAVGKQGCNAWLEIDRSGYCVRPRGHEGIHSLDPLPGDVPTAESRYDDTRRYLEGDTLDPRCTGYVDEIGYLAHDGDTCPVHESGDVDPGDEVQSSRCRGCSTLIQPAPEQEGDAERDYCADCIASNIGPLDPADPTDRQTLAELQAIRQRDGGPARTYTIVLIDRDPEHASDGDFAYVEGITYDDVNGPGREKLADRLADAVAALDARP